MTGLSIVTVSLNTKDLTIGCIESILKEGSKLTKQIIVVDNGSSDGSVEALRKFKKKVKGFILIENSGNFGYAKANNQGIKKAKNKYILLLNNDTIVKRNALSNLMDFAKKTKDAGVIGSRLLNIDGTLQSSCYHFPTIKNAVWEYWFGKKGLFEKFAPKGENAVEVDAVVGAAFLMTPQALKKVGALDERYFAYFEDIDYCRNTWKAGLKVYYLPSSVILHYHGATFKKLASAKDRWKKLIPSSKVYHGFIKHYLITIILWTGQKRQKLFQFFKT